MAIRVVRLGTPRASDEGLRLGTARRPPRGVAKADFAKRDFFDVWLPQLAPSQPLVSWATSEAWTPKRWRLFSKRYLSEMRRPEAVRLIAMLAAFSQQTNFSIGCYCEDPTQCHRSLLRGLLIKAGAELK